MDRDLWTWSYDQDVHESNDCIESGRQADYYFDHKEDVIEVNAMNEKYCNKVLKMLIRKADHDINELEKDLLLLQCDLTWTESKNQLEVCCRALREKIDVLDGSIKSLRILNETNEDNQLPIHRQPAEKLCEVLKPLLGESCQQDDELVSYSYGTLSISSKKVNGEVMEDDGSLPAADSINNGSSQEFKENSKIPGEEVQLEVSTSGLCSPVLTELENLASCVSEIEIEEAKEHCIVATEMSRKLNSSTNLDGESSPPKARKDGKSVSEEVDDDPDIPRRSDGNKRPFDPDLSFLVQSNSGNSNVEEKLIEFFIRNKKKKKKRNEEPTVLQSDRSTSSSLSSNTKENIENDLKVLKTEESGSFDTWNFPLFLLSELQDRLGEDKTQSHTKEQGKVSLENSQNVENASHDCKAKALAEKGQRKKKHPKPEKKVDNAAKRQDDALNDDKGSSKVAVVGRELENLSVADIFNLYKFKPEDVNGNEDGAMPKPSSSPCCTSDYCSTETLANRHSTNKKLTDLTLVDLRTLARRLKLTKYHKLPKKVLLDLLVSQMEASAARMT